MYLTVLGVMLFKALYIDMYLTVLGVMLFKAFIYRYVSVSGRSYAV